MFVERQTPFLYDEKTGESDWKPVVRLFRNETKEWYHIFVNGEEIVCTGGHPFYVGDKGFVEAKDLKISDKLLLSSGKRVIIEKLEVETLEQAETTYNFEVADFHTYYVSEANVLVHNKCTPSNSKYYSPDEIAKRYDITVEQYHKQVKPKILSSVKPNYQVGRNPNIMLNNLDEIAYQGVNGRGFQDTGLNMIDILKQLKLK